MNELFAVVTWPECQHYMGLEGWVENSHLINDDKGIEQYGSSAYFVNNNWLNDADSKLTSV